MYDYYGTNTIASSSDVAVASTILGFLTAYFAVIGVILVLMIISDWFIFKKANKPGWASIVPIYNIVVKYQIANINPLFILLFLIPFVNGVAAIVLNIMLGINLAKAFGKSGGFAVGLIFLPMIFYPILAFGKAEYQGV